MEMESVFSFWQRAQLTLKTESTPAAFKWLNRESISWKRRPFSKGKLLWMMYNMFMTKEKVKWAKHKRNCNFGDDEMFQVNTHYWPGLRQHRTRWRYVPGQYILLTGFKTAQNLVKHDGWHSHTYFSSPHHVKGHQITKQVQAWNRRIKSY